MSVSHASPTSTSRDTGAASLLRWVTGRLLVAAVLAGLTLALWPASEADKARADGEQFGEAVAQLHNADTSDEVDAALVELDQAVTDTRDHAGDAVATQADDQADALPRCRWVRRRQHDRQRVRPGPVPGRARRGTR